MSMYDPTGMPGSDVDWGIDFPDKSAVVKFSEFRRGDEGDIIVANKPDGKYYQRDGQWYARGDTADEGSSAVAEVDVKYSDYVYARMEVVSPVEVAGGELPLRVKLKGIYCYQRDGEWFFTLPGSGLDRRPDGERFRPTGLFQQAKEMGFQIPRLDPESPLCEKDESGTPLYIAGEVASLADKMYDPLEPVHVLEHVIEAKLKQAAEAGHLFAVQTSNIGWIVWNSLAALTAEDAAVISQQVSQGEDEANVYRQQIRKMAKVAPNPEEFALEIYNVAVGVQVDVVAKNLLASCNLETLEHIVTHFSGEAKEGGEVSL